MRSLVLMRIVYVLLLSFYYSRVIVNMLTLLSVYYFVFCYSLDFFSNSFQWILSFVHRLVFMCFQCVSFVSNFVYGVLICIDWFCYFSLTFPFYYFAWLLSNVVKFQRNLIYFYLNMNFYLNFAFLMCLYSF